MWKPWLAGLLQTTFQTFYLQMLIGSISKLLKTYNLISNDKYSRRPFLLFCQFATINKQHGNLILIDQYTLCFRWENWFVISNDILFPEILYWLVRPRNVSIILPQSVETKRRDCVGYETPLTRLMTCVVGETHETLLNDWLEYWWSGEWRENEFPHLCWKKSQNLLVWLLGSFKSYTC